MAPGSGGHQVRPVQFSNQPAGTCTATREVHLTATHWQDYLQRLAQGVRRMAPAHPQVFPLVATRGAGRTWVRPPLRSLRWMEILNHAPVRVHRRRVLAAYRASSSFLLGPPLLVEVSERAPNVSPIEQADPRGQPGPTTVSIRG